MKNKYIEELSGCANMSSNFEGQVPENMSKIVTPEDFIGSDPIEDLKHIGTYALPESTIKFYKNINIDKYCFD